MVVHMRVDPGKSCIRADSLEQVCVGAFAMRTSRLAYKNVHAAFAFPVIHIGASRNSWRQ